MSTDSPATSLPQTLAASQRRRPATPDELLWGPPLIQAVESGNAAALHAIVRAWPKAARAMRNNLTTMLHLAAARGLVNVAEVLLQYRADVDARDQNKATPLHLAAFNGTLGLIRTLILHGAAPNAIDAARQTPLDMAIQGKQKQAAAFLREYGAGRYVDLTDPKGRTPLHRAAAGAEAGQVSALLQRGARVHVRDRRGWAPLHAAAASGCAQTVGLLLDAGAYVDARNEDGCTPLHVAAEAGHWRVVRDLLEAGARVDARRFPAVPQDGQLSLFGPEYTSDTPLHLAVRQGHAQAVRFLLEAGADAHLLDDYGLLPLLVAVRAGNAEIVSAFVLAGASLGAVDAGGWNALDIAVMEGHEEVARVLRAARPEWRNVMEPPPDSLADLKARIAKLSEDSCAEDFAEGEKGMLAVLANLVARVEHLEYLNRQGKKPGAGGTAKVAKPAGQEPPQPEGPAGDACTKDYVATCAIHPTHLNLKCVAPGGIRYRPCVPGRTNAQGGSWEEWVTIEDDPPGFAALCSVEHGGYTYELCLRTAFQFAELARRYTCEVSVSQGEEHADGKSFASVGMILYGTERTAAPLPRPPIRTLEVRCSGADATECLASLVALLESPFREAPRKPENDTAGDNQIL